MKPEVNRKPRRRFSPKRARLAVNFKDGFDKDNSSIQIIRAVRGLARFPVVPWRCSVFVFMVFCFVQAKLSG
jgi:hypothetical protein